jgi:hypothetical protein
MATLSPKLLQMSPSWEQGLLFKIDYLVLQALRSCGYLACPPNLTHPFFTTCKITMFKVEEKKLLVSEGYKSFFEINMDWETSNPCSMLH